MSVFGDYGVEILLENDQDFLKIRETLTRMGIASYNPEKVGSKGKALIQTAHILHKKSNYAIVHFKELFKMDGKDKFIEDGTLKETVITEDDLGRRNMIAFLLQEWGLLKVKFPDKYKEQKASLSKIKIISHRDKDDWNLVSKHSLGRKKS